MTSAFYLAQLNIGELRYPRETSEMAGYREALGPITSIATTWPGFIWIQDDSIIGMAEHMFGAGVAANLSIWRDVESLQGFITCPEHATVMDRGAEWFIPIDEATFVLWWVPTSHIPALDEGHERLMLLRREGPTSHAFDLDHTFPPPSQSG